MTCSPPPNKHVHLLEFQVGLHAILQMLLYVVQVLLDWHRINHAGHLQLGDTEQVRAGLLRHMKWRSLTKMEWKLGWLLCSEW